MIAPQRIGHRRREGGAALLVALVLVLVGTLLGVSVMEASGTEARLVDNERYREAAFRAAEAASGGAVDCDQLTTLAGATGAQSATVTSVDTNVSVDASVRLDGVGHVTGFSIGTFQNYLLSGTADATIDGVDAARRVRQGLSCRGKAVPTS